VAPPHKVFSNPESFGADLHSELLLQERLDENPEHRSFSWQVLRKASEYFGAKPYIGETGFTTPPSFSNARRGAKITWEALDDSPVIVNWSGLDPSEQAEITSTLEAANNWIIFTHPLGPEKRATPPIPAGAQRILSGGGSFGKAEFAAACLALEDSLTHDQPIPTDSKGFQRIHPKDS